MHTGIFKDTLQDLECNDCSVISVSLVAHVNYLDAHKALALQGRKAHCGAKDWQILAALKNLGVKIASDINIRQKSGSRYTPKTIARKLKIGRYLCFTSDHVFLLEEGIVNDWVRGKRHRINYVVEVSS